MQQRSFIITVALVAGLALGVTVAPHVYGTTANAQTQPPARTQAAAPGNNLRNIFLDKLASALGIQRSALDTALKDAGTATADEAVKQGRLTQEQADRLKAGIQSGDFPGFFGGRGGKRAAPHLAGVHQAMFDAAAKALGITTNEFKTQLRAGQTVAQIAQARGVAEKVVTSAALAAAKTQLDQAVAGGTVTQAQADQMYARLQQAGSQIFGRTPHPGRGRSGRHQQPQAPANPQAPSTSQGI